MKDRKFWIDISDKKHLAYSVVSTIIIVLLSWEIFITKSFSYNGNVISVIEQYPEKDILTFDDIYKSTIVVQKIRSDCGNARATRYMHEINQGSWYLVEDIEAVQLRKREEPWNFPLRINLKPKNQQDNDLMKPGIWEIISRVVYDCDGNEVDYTFYTPPFKVVEK